MIETLDPCGPDFDYFLWLAHGWTQQRKKYYFRTGGYQEFEDYLRIARADNRKQFAVTPYQDARYVSLVTVEMFAKDSYEFHVTSKHGVAPGLIWVALLELSAKFFTDLKAKYLVTTVPRYNGHWHAGSRKMAEYLGCVPDGEPEKADWVDGKMIEYQLYVLSREAWINGRRRQEITV